MNAQVQALVEQAKQSVPAGLAPEQWLEVYHAKFAELIVKECASIADQERPNSLGCGYITKTKGRLILDHFGVEE
jgi:hypothetical protein